MEIAPRVLQDPRGSFRFPQQETAEYGTGNREEVLASTADTWNIYANLRGVTLV